MSHLLGRLAFFFFFVASSSNLYVFKLCTIVKGFFCSNICFLLELIPVLDSLFHFSQKKSMKCVKSIETQMLTLAGAFMCCAFKSLVHL